MRSIIELISQSDNPVRVGDFSSSQIKDSKNIIWDSSSWRISNEKGRLFFWKSLLIILAIRMATISQVSHLEGKSSDHQIFGVVFVWRFIVL